MKRVWSILGWMTLVVALILGATIAALWLALPLDGTTISIDGETFSLANLSGGELALAFVAAVLASLLALAIGALAAVLGLAAGAIGIGLGILAAVAALALVASPFLLIGWLVWRAVRGPRAVATTTAA
jgi:hypothetical protein|nr:hypothetical protein [Caldimonas sp.]